LRGARRGVRGLRLDVDHGSSKSHDGADGSADADAGLMQLRVSILLSVLVMANAAHLAMWVTLWRARSKGAAELAWAVVPWLITALGAAPGVHHVFSAGQRVDASVEAAVSSPSGMEKENVAPGPPLLASAQRWP